MLFLVSSFLYECSFILILYQTKSIFSKYILCQAPAAEQWIIRLFPRVVRGRSILSGYPAVLTLCQTKLNFVNIKFIYSSTRLSSFLFSLLTLFLSFLSLMYSFSLSFILTSPLQTPFLSLVSKFSLTRFSLTLCRLFSSLSYPSLLLTVFLLAVDL